MKNTLQLPTTSVVINHLLVINDDPITDVILQEIGSNTNVINRFNFIVDGLQALEYLRFCKKTKDFPDLIIVDLNKSLRHGVEFLKFYKELYFHKFRDTKIVVLTDQGMTFQKELFFLFSSNYLFLNKPLTKEKFNYIYQTLFL